MKVPSLQKTAALSAALHVTFFLISAFILKQSSHVVLPSPYTVNLVGQDIGPHESEKSTGPSDQDSLKPAAAEKEIPKSEKISKKDEKRVDEMISAIAAKKKIKTIGELRKEISIGKAERSGRKPIKQGKGVNRVAASSPSPGITGGMAYEDKIRDEIHRQWFWPDTSRKDLETIITVRIRKDGTIPLQNIVVEKKSGSRLFDNYAVQAIAKASPVSPPPHEMEIGIRFYP